MASFSLPNNMPQPSDARGLLIPDDLVKNKDYIRSDPVDFWSSYQFYVKARGSNFHFEVTKYLSAIPAHHFSLIKSLCLDFGFDAQSNFPLAGDSYEPLKWLCGEILDRAPDVVLKFIMGDNQHISIRPFNHRYSEGWEYVDINFNYFWSKFKTQFRDWGYNTDHIKIIRARKWKYNELDLRDRDKEMRSRSVENSNGSAESNEAQDQTLSIRIMVDPPYEPDEQEPYLLEDYENKIFEIDPNSKKFVWKELWHPQTDWFEETSSMLLRWDSVRGHY